MTTQIALALPRRLLLAAVLLSAAAGWAQTPAAPTSARPGGTPAPRWVPVLPPPTAANVTYGSNPRQVFDVWQPTATAPTPVIIYFHGGGFTSGDKAQESRAAELLAICQRQHWALISANYRFIVGPDGAPMPAPFRDAARVLQTVRQRAAEWQIDPRRVVVSGGSAGGILALYLGLHDDLADPQAKDDPVARQSTRVRGILTWVASTSCDPRLAPQFGLTSAAYAANLTRFFSVKSAEELETPALRRLIADQSALDLASKDDPPSLLLYDAQNAPLPLPAGMEFTAVAHHAYWGKLLKDRMDALGVPCTTYPGYPAQPLPKDAMEQFLLQRLATP